MKIFLKKKTLTELLFKLKRAYSNSAKKRADIDDIRKVLYSTLSIDSPFVESDNQENVAADERHFENPLKEEFVDEEELPETEDVRENESEFDLGKQEETEAFVDVEQTVEIPFSEDEEKIDEKLSEDLEEAIKISEPEKFEVKSEEPQSLEITSEESNDLVINEIDSSSDVTEMELVVSDTNPVEESESLLKESIDEEDVLASLTEEIEKDKNKDDEIIILDEKEQEDLLNFYDNELEISIDDDLPIGKDKNPESDENASDEINELVFEHDLQVEDDGAEDEVPIEKIDFEKDLLGVEDTKLTEDVQEENLSEPSVSKKNDDIFTYLSKKEIDRVIKNLFNSDSEDFANTVEKMSLCETYQEASVILENIFKYARIKPHSRDAASLTTAVAKYFNVEK